MLSIGSVGHVESGGEVRHRGIGVVQRPQANECTEGEGTDGGVRVSVNGGIRPK